MYGLCNSGTPCLIMSQIVIAKRKHLGQLRSGSYRDCTNDSLLTFRERVGLHNVKERVHHVEQYPYYSRFVMGHGLVNS